MSRRFLLCALMLTGVACILMVTSSAYAGERPVRPRPVVGVLTVTKAKAEDGTETVTAAKITVKREEREIVFNVVLDDVGKKLAGELADKKVSATGTVAEKENDKGEKERWLTVKEYKAVEEKPVEKPAEK